jgi:hypothetical protein
MRCFLAVLGLALCLGCRSGAKPAGGGEPSLRLVVVTDLKGYLEPCGCTSDPLGGIDRLAAQIKTLRKNGVPVVVLLTGDTFFDAATLDPARVDQANRNAQTLVRILNNLGVTALLPGSRDREQPAQAIESLRAESEFPWLAVGEDTNVLIREAGDLAVGIVGARAGTKRGIMEAAVDRVRARADLAVVLVDGSRRDANLSGSIDGVDFVIQGGLDQDEAMPPRQAGKAWILHASRQGQGLTVVDLYHRSKHEGFADRSEWSRTERVAQLDRQIQELRTKLAAWEKIGDTNPSDLEAQRGRLADLEKSRALLDAPAATADGNSFVARWVELRKTSPSDAAVSKLMREHDKVVNEANRVAFADLKPPPLGPNDVAYVGSAVCSGCHQSAYAWWRNHSHGVAYLTLQQRSKEYNLDCVGCHVTGYQQPGGSTVTHNLDGQLRNVGCESCHGPGAAHANDPEVAVVRVTPEATCVACHNQQHSDLFDYEAYVKTLIVPGHGLPEKTGELR